MNIKCLLGFHDPEIVLNTGNNKLTEICKRCKIILNEEKGDLCCSSCIAADVRLRMKLRKQGKAINLSTLRWKDKI